MQDLEQITFFAKTDARGQEVPFGIKASDRTRHVYVIGKTGMGKSTLLENMAVQDIKNGNGFAFIDPHGQTAETLLDFIPEERKDDVVYFAPFDTDYPISFNVMEDVGPDRRHLVVSGLMSVFKKIWVDAWSARMEYILSNTLLALLEYPDSTLLGVNRMLSDKVYRKKVIDNITDPAVKSFWVDEFLKYNERYMQEAGDAIKNKIGQFTSNPLIRNIVGQSHSSFDIRKIMDEKKILIMNLSKGLVGESNANLLGSMLTTRIYLAAMSRADLSQAEMRETPNFYFYVDEFQSFANATFADILSEARKYKLNLTIAHQYIEQMEEEVRNAVFGNVGTIISFRVGPFDAEILETIYTPKFLAPDIVNLGFAQIYLTLMIDGIGSKPFSATTLPPIESSHTSCKDMVIASSRKQFTYKRVEVEEKIYAWHATGDASTQKNTNERGSYKRNSKSEKKPYTKNREDKPLKKENSSTENETPKNVVRATVDTKNIKKYNNRPTSDKPSEASLVKNTNTNTKQSRVPLYKKHEKSLEDLRAVLQTISGKDNIKNEKRESVSRNSTQEKFSKNNKQQTSDVSPHNSLKAVIAQAQQEPTKKQIPIQQPSIRQQIPIQVKNNNPHNTSYKPSDKTQKTISTEEVSTYKQVKNIDDPLSPKKLERMMRITGNDKVPLK